MSEIAETLRRTRRRQKAGLTLIGAKIAGYPVGAVAEAAAEVNWVVEGERVTPDEVRAWWPEREYGP